jgi:hypothetical protein
MDYHAESPNFKFAPRSIKANRRTVAAYKHGVQSLAHVQGEEFASLKHSRDPKFVFRFQHGATKL